MAASSREDGGLDSSETLDNGGLTGQYPAGDSKESQVVENSTPPEAGDPVGQSSSTASSTSSGVIEASQTEPELETRHHKTEGKLLDKIKAFQDQREEERRRLFRAFVRLFLRLCAIGGIFVGVGHGLRFALPESHVPGAIIIVAFSIIMFGVVLGSCCPYDLLDFDEVSRRNPKSMGTFIFFSSIVNVLQVRYFPHLDVLKLACALVMSIATLSRACGLQPSRWWPANTTACAWYLILDGFSWAGIFFFADQNDWLAIPQISSRILACFNLLYGLAASTGWFCHRRRYPDIDHGGSRRYYKVLYFWAVAFGIRWALYGTVWIASPREGSEDVVAGALELVRGLCTMLPSAAVVIVGRDRFFRTVGRWFDKDGARLRRDGAFVAELLENVPVRIGQPWWVHREMENDNYPPFDPRRCWQKGFVTEIANESELVVRVQEPRLSGRRTSMRRSDMSDSSNDATLVRMMLPTLHKSESKEDLLLRAQRDLRCVEFENLSPDLMYRVDSRNKPELQAAWHALSRPVRPGEKIDCFMSNSWYDDPETKWEKLVEVAERFQRRSGRYPTFWLDKLCIDQQQITDGLKVLPVNVMACTKLLALCGDTYLSRLWCVWELFTLFAFVDEAAALDRVEFVFLGTFEEGMHMLDGMAKFHVNTAHCYDPNEEARLMQVIDAVGTSRFNTRVSNMANMTKERLVKLESKKRSRGSGSASRIMTATRSISGSWSRKKSTASERSSNTAPTIADDGIMA